MLAGVFVAQTLLKEDFKDVFGMVIAIETHRYYSSIIQVATVSTSKNYPWKSSRYHLHDGSLTALARHNYHYIAVHILYTTRPR